jgi:hypothetical protein
VTAYYYFATSLPLLEFGKPAPIADDHFAAGCRENLAPTDMTALEELLGLPPGAPRPSGTFARRWQRTDDAIRNAVAGHRAAEQRVDPEPFLREGQDYSPSLERRVADALAKKPPTAAERALDALRWDLIEELAGVDPFKIDAILAYALKLRILKKWSSLCRPAGHERLQDLVEAKLNPGPDANRERTDEPDDSAPHVEQE